LICPSCFPPEDDSLDKIDYKLTDPEVRTILDAQDRHLRDTLLIYFHHKNASYRYLSALAFASVRDTLAIKDLTELLNDHVEEVKQAAAFALGQIANPAAQIALIRSFVAVDSFGAFNKTNAIILEALGKCGTDSTLQLICQIKTYQPDDSLLMYGQMAAFYRFGLREMICNESVEYILKVAVSNDYPVAARLMAAHCLQRIKSFDLSAHFEVLKKACNEEKNPEIRMCLVSALARNTSTAAMNAMEELYSRGLDIRIQTNIVRGLMQHNSSQARFFALKALQNPSLHVSVYAAQYLLDKGNADIAEELKSLTERNNLPWQIRSLVFQAALKHIPMYLVLTRQAIEGKLIDLVNQSKSPYEKAAYLKALTNNTKSLDFFLGLKSNDMHPYLRTTIAECISVLLNKADFFEVYKGSKNYIYYQLADYFNKQCDKADPGTLAVMASVFTKPIPYLNKLFKADSMLAVAQLKLKLPRDIETYNELGKTIAGLKKTTFIPKTPEYNHPINWSLLEKYRDTIPALIKTNKGEIGIELYPRAAPASVINFIQLSQDGFYKDKVFHRVVPNFVVQVGCPRGDGYGALDYTLRTEISLLNYQEGGMIGMASAGADTEGTQFFITHSPTPHLDGRYSIFAKMISGNEVLMSLSQGDVIKEIDLAGK
jgi:cyclophilin family peptidyl-prolyl cis-trans isomerase/HEAT repeat protein